MGAIRRAGKLGPESFSDLLLVKGLVRSTVRSLAFVSSLIYRRDLASRDPVAYAYNVGGKDGIPFPVDRKTYDDVIHEMRHIIDSANMGHDEKYKALRRLATVIN